MNDDVVETLLALRAPHVLVQKAYRGLLGTLECMMPDCLCPESLGGRSHFTKTGRVKDNPWMITVDHELPRYYGGSDSLDNLRPAHAKCNQHAGAKISAVIINDSAHKADPNYRATRVRNGYALNDPSIHGHAALLARSRRAAAAQHELRATCQTCGMVSTPGPMGRHFKASGHQKASLFPA